MKSEYFVSYAGVRQGENLSQVLFFIYIKNSEQYLITKGNTFVNFKDEISNNYVKLLVLLYTDDTILLPNSTPGLQKALNDLNQYYKERTL